MNSHRTAAATHVAFWLAPLPQPAPGPADIMDVKHISLLDTSSSSSAVVKNSGSKPWDLTHKKKKKKQKPERESPSIKKSSLQLQPLLLFFLGQEEREREAINQRRLTLRVGPIRSASSLHSICGRSPLVVASELARYTLPSSVVLPRSIAADTPAPVYRPIDSTYITQIPFIFLRLLSRCGNSLVSF